MKILLVLSAFCYADLTAFNRYRNNAAVHVTTRAASNAEEKSHLNKVVSHLLKSGWDKDLVQQLHKFRSQSKATKRFGYYRRYQEK